MTLRFLRCYRRGSVVYSTVRWVFLGPSRTWNSTQFHASFLLIRKLSRNRKHNKKRIYNNAYREKLLDKRWEIKRNQILKRDNFHCVICGNSKYLVVHHKLYHYSKILNRFFDPWDYKDSYLITLCESCHKRGHELYNIPVFNI